VGLSEFRLLQGTATTMASTPTASHSGCGGNHSAASFQAVGATDNDLSTNWVGVQGTADCEVPGSRFAPLVYDFGSPIFVDSYIMGTPRDHRWNPVKWRIEASNDGVAWTVLDEVTVITNGALPGGGYEPAYTLMRKTPLSNHCDPATAAASIVPFVSGCEKNTSECCEEKPVCSVNDCDGINYVRNTFMDRCAAKVCLNNECCQAAPAREVCTEIHCADSVTITGPNPGDRASRTYLPGKHFAPSATQFPLTGCTADDCCADNNVCSSAVCSTGYHMKVVALVSCFAQPCTSDECCQQNPSCQASDCGAGSSRNTKATPCDFSVCDVAECCFQHPFCAASNVPSTHVLTGDPATPCIGVACTVADSIAARNARRATRLPCLIARRV
jgi:hypothetical protein